jgi:hypothetical protein
MFDKIYGMVVEFIWHVQPSTFCDLRKLKKEMEFKFKIFRNIFGEGKEYKNKVRVIIMSPH